MQFVADKVAYALEQGLKVLPCVGETLEQREAGKTMDVITEQLKAIAGQRLVKVVLKLKQCACAGLILAL